MSKNASGKLVEILLVEDNPADARLIREALAEMAEVSFNLECAGTLSEGLSRLGEGEVDLVLLDLGLPDSDGIETLTRVRTEMPAVPIVVLTGLQNDAGGVEAIRQGAQDYVRKERVDGRVLARSIRYAVERKKAQRRLEAYQTRLRSLASELAVAQERERRRIAIELHDRIGQTLVFAKMKLGELQACIPAGAEDKLSGMQGLLDGMIGEIRSLTFELSPPVLYELGLEAALEWLAERIEQQYGLKVELHDDGQPKPLGKDTRALLFRAVQELLVNVARHAHAGEARVSIWRESDFIRIEVQDNGKGFLSDEVLSCAGERDLFGLFSIQERAAELGGELKIKSSPGEGTQAVLTIPVTRTWRAKRRE